MHSKYRLWAPLASLLTLVALGGCDWPMFQHDAGRSGTSPVDTSSASGTLRWSSQSILPFSQPIAGIAAIYVGGADGYLYAVQASDGKLLWKFPVNPATMFFDFPGLVGTPAIARDGTIYVGLFSVGDPSFANLYAVNPDGSERWRFGMGSSSGGPAIGTDGTIYAAGDTYLYAINPDGSQKWVAHYADRFASYPAIGPDGTIYSYFQSSAANPNPNGLYALNPDGSLRHIFPEPIDAQCSAPSVGSNGLIFLQCVGVVVALHSDGSLSWTASLGKVYPDTFDSPTNNGAAVYVTGQNQDTGDDFLYAIDAFFGTVKWSFLLPGGSVVPSSTTPVVAKEGTVYVVARDGALYAVKPDGTKRWSLSGQGFSTAAAMATLIIGFSSSNSIYLGCAAGLCAVH